MPPSRAEQKLIELGLALPSPAATIDTKTRRPIPSGPVSPRKRVTYKLFFPRPPYNGALYHAAFTNGLYNFVGLVLGHQGTTIQQIQRDSGCRVEIHDKDGNLNGDHPSAADPTLHALVVADNNESLTKAVEMLLDVLAPINTDFAPIKIVPNGGAVLDASIHAPPPPAPAITIKQKKPTSTVAGTAPPPPPPPTNVQQKLQSTDTNNNETAATANDQPLPQPVWGPGLSHKNSFTIPSAPPPPPTVTQPSPAASKEGATDDESGNSVPLDSHRSSRSSLSEEVCTPHSQNTGLLGMIPLSQGGSQASISSGYGLGLFDNTNSLQHVPLHLNHHHHTGGETTQTATGGLPEFSLWNPFAAGGLLDDLQQTLSPEQQMQQQGTTLVGLSAAPFPGVGSWSRQGSMNGGVAAQTVSTQSGFLGGYSVGSLGSVFK